MTIMSIIRVTKQFTKQPVSQMKKNKSTYLRYAICFFIINIDLALVSEKLNYIALCFTIISISQYNILLPKFKKLTKHFPLLIKKIVTLCLCLNLELTPHLTFSYLTNSFIYDHYKEQLKKLDNNIKQKFETISGDKAGASYLPPVFT